MEKILYASVKTGNSKTIPFQLLLCVKSQRSVTKTPIPWNKFTQSTNAFVTMATKETDWFVKVSVFFYLFSLLILECIKVVFRC